MPDAPLRQAFETCEIGHLAVPRGEAPFSMITLYSAKVPLFSDAPCETFARRYSEVAHGTGYNVYECKPR